MIMSKPQLLDTDVLIDYLRGSDPAVRYFAEAQERLLISAVSVAELYAGVKGEAEEIQLADFIASFEIAEIDFPTARQGGLFRNQYFRSHGVGLADALIAASAIRCAACLITLNQKHFPMLSDVEVPYRKE